MELIPEFIGLNIGFLLMLLWIYEPLSEEFAAAMALFMAVGVAAYRIYRELRVVSFVKKAPFRVRMGRTTIFADSEEVAGVFKDPAVFVKGLPRFVYVGSYPCESATRIGTIVGVVNTDVLEGSVRGAISSLERPALWWLDFTSPIGAVVRVLLPVLALQLPLKTAVAALVVAGILFGIVDSMNLDMTSV